MTFRKNRFFFIECSVCAVIFTMLSLIMMFISLDKGKQSVFLWLIFAAFWTFITICSFKWLNNEYITIDENGISCKRKSKLLWSFKWDEIAKLQKSRELGNPGIAIITYNKKGESEYSFENGGHSFQLCKMAKQALQFYGKTIEK